MKNIKIKKVDFINWYFFTGCDQEQEETLKSLGESVVEQLKSGVVTITPESLLEECNPDLIPLDIVQDMNGENSDMEIWEAVEEGLISDDCEIELI